MVDNDTKIVNLNSHKLRDHDAVLESASENDQKFHEVYDQIPVGILEEDYSHIKTYIDSQKFNSSFELRDHFKLYPDRLLPLIRSVRIINVNPAGLAVYGACSKEEYVADHANYSDWMASDWLNFYVEEISALFEGRSVFQREFSDTSVNGDPIEIRNVTRIAAGHEHDWKRLISVVEDISERKSLEAESNQSQKMDAISQLTGGLAHDINNIFAIISGHAEHLESSIPNNDQSLKGIFTAVNQGSSLIRQMLSFSKNQPLVSKVVDINTVVGDLTSLIRRTLGESIDIEFTNAPDLWNAMTDSNRLENAVLNLVLNSRDAMISGGKLRISTYNCTVRESFSNCNFVITAGEYVVVSVTDSGIGMSEYQLSKVFEPYFTTKDYGKGSGLGLSSVYGFARQSKGHVSIYSTKDVGTEVRLYLPRTRDQEEILLPRKKEEQLLACGETVLVVEDEQVLCELVCTMLRELGYHVHVARYGLEAMDILQNKPSIDVLLSDLGLPGGMSGVDVAKRAVMLHQDIKVLFMSGYVKDALGDYPDIYQYGKVLDKPFRKNQLAKCLRGLLDRPPVE